MSAIAMKLLVILASFIALCAGNAIPMVPGDNSHYVEGESRYIWMPDGEGVPHLVDLEEPVDEEALRAATKNGANNQYWLFTRSNPNSAQIITNGNALSVWLSNYGSGRPTIVIVHGWNNNGNSEVNTYIRSAFLDVMDCNVIVVDWRNSANGSYNTAAAAVPSVGQFLGNFLQWLLNTAGGNWNNVHLIGFSLGAHIVGNAGRTVGGQISRITGLDPAGPNWGGNNNALKANDAQYVEAIHTNGGTLGINDPIGGANFYPNGGRNQIGCILTCAHGRSYEYMAASVRFNHLVGKQCSNLQQANNNQCNGSNFNMGNGILNKRGSGLYAMSTSASWPY